MAKKEVFSPKIERIEKSKHKLNSGKLKAIILSLVIAIVLAFFVGYLIQAIYPSPKYDDYCKINPPNIENMTKLTCETYNGTWIQDNIQNIKSPYASPIQGYCDFYTECNKGLQNAQDKYNLVVFVVAVIVGLISVALGIALSLPSVSLGLMIGGAFLTIYGSARYWYKLSNWFRVILLGIALVVLIWLGYKKLQS